MKKTKNYYVQQISTFFNSIFYRRVIFLSSGVNNQIGDFNIGMNELTQYISFD